MIEMAITQTEDQKTIKQQYHREYYIKNHDKLLQKRIKNREELCRKSKEYYKTHKEERKKYRQKHGAKSQRKYRKKIRFDVINHYGGKCACCGESIIDFLSIDHIKNNGSKHRKKIGCPTSGFPFYRWLIKNNYPKDFQVMCMNCNWGKRMNGGICPHKKENEK